MHKLRITILLILITLPILGQNGKIVSKRLITIENTTFWGNISENDSLKKGYQYLTTLNFSEIEYLSDSLHIKGLIVEPKAAGKYPVIIFNRGGNRTFGALSLGTIITYTSKLAAQGYIILASNYREQDEFGGKEINDVLNLIETTKTIQKADTTRIGMFGWSRGGMMTYLALKNSAIIKTAVVGNAPTNLFSTLQKRPELEKNVFSECIPNYWKKKEEELKNRSVVYWAEKLNKESSLLILYGTKDRHVNFKQAERLAEKLKSINYNFRVKGYKTDHFFSNKKEELNSELIKWFNTNL